MQEKIRSPQCKQGDVFEVQRTVPLLCAVVAPIERTSKQLQFPTWSEPPSNPLVRRRSRRRSRGRRRRQREGGSPPRRNGAPGPIIRIVISLLIVWHFTGVFLAALSIPASSPLVMNIAQKRPMQWYLDALYLNQGHSFFAPDVGPGHIIRYELLDQSGRAIEQGELPSRKEHWPRLFYHRHMMLADQSELPSDDKQFRDYWQRKYLRGLRRHHLLHVNENGAQRAAPAHRTLAAAARSCRRKARR